MVDRVKPLHWDPDVGGGSVAVRPDRTVYRIVLSYGVYCLRHEVGGAYDWMGQFASAAQAQAKAEERELELRRLKAWDKYMRRHDPPSDMGPEWQL